MNRATQNETNLSVLAAGIVSNALFASYHLFCPFCSDFYLFEFSFKDHLKREHADLLQKHFKHSINDIEMKCEQSQPNCFTKEFNHVCDLCGAMFLYAGLIPKHIINYHGTAYFSTWQRQQQQQQQCAGFSNDQVDANSDVTIMYAKCSPGLSDIFDKMSTNDTDEFSIDRTPLKSILKKSESKSIRIISSPSSSSIRRIRNSSVIKRNSSARRILRFDVENVAPDNAVIASAGIVGQDDVMNSILPNAKKSNKRRSVGRIVRRIFFGTCAPKANKNRSPVSNRIVTSTPINLFCDTFN